MTEIEHRVNNEASMNRLDPVVGALRNFANEFPGKLALLSPDSRVTFGDLAKESDRIASMILASETDRSRPVMILLDDPTSVFCAAFGVLQAGGYSAILDPHSPREHIDRVVSLARAETSIVDSKTSGLIDLKEISFGDSPAAGIDMIDLPWTPDEPAMIAFTSGSTGHPKGLIISRRELSSLVRSTAASVDRAGRQGVFGSFGFARGIVTVFRSVLEGQTVALYHVANKSLARAARWIVESEVSAITVQASFLRQLLRASDDRFENVQDVGMGGERVTRADIELVRRRFSPGTTVGISYASTEAGRVTKRTIESTEVLEDDPIGVGHPVAGVIIHVEGDDGRALDSGECGEIVVSIPWRRSLLLHDRSSDVVTPDPERDGHWRVRTGDLGFVQADGMLYVLGRRDRQLKIRGSRVEPAEVESAILKNRRVDEVVVMGIPDDSGELSLCAFVGAASGTDETELARELRSKLPSYMVPSSIHVLPSLPSMSNGKPDRVALTKVARERMSSRDLSKPATEDDGQVSNDSSLEERIASIWSDVLQRDSIGENDDFFAIGGNSLQAAHMFGKLEQVMERELPLSLLLESSTVLGLAGRLRSLARSDDAEFGAVVHLGGSGDGIPIFFFSGSGGDLLFLRDVVPELPADQPFYGVRGIGLDGGPIPPPSYPAIAALLVDEIRRIRPGGPVVLAGHSSGGSLALEVAHQLHDLDGQAPLVIAVDTPGWRPDRSALSRALNQVLNLATNPRRIPSYLRTLKFNLEIHLGLRKRPTRMVDEAGDGRFSRVKSIYIRASGNYSPKPYPGDVTLIRAADGMFRHSVPGHFGWEHVVKRKFDVITMPGDHVSVIEGHPEEFARMLVEQVRRRIR